MCHFCGQSFADVADKEDHILDHFNRKHCFGCDNELISMGGKWYQLHIDINCNTIKLEPDYDDTRMHNSSNASPLTIDSVKDEPNEMLAPADALPLEEIMLPEATATDCGASAESHDGLQVGEPTMNHETASLHSGQHSDPADGEEEREQIGSDSAKTSDTKPFQCSLCPAGYFHASSLNKHKRVLHTEEKERLRRIADKRRQQKQSLKPERSPRAAKLQRYKCRFCWNKYCHSYRLLNHVKKYHKQEYDEHRLRNATANPTELELTASDFNDSSGDGALKGPAESQPEAAASTSTARQTKPFKCSACLLRFVHENSLSKHAKQCSAKRATEEPAESTAAENRSLTKYNADVWSCDICAVSFNWERNAYKHLRSVHGSDDRTSIKSEVQVRYMHMWYCSLCYLPSIHRTYFQKHLSLMHNVNDMTVRRPIQDWQDPDQLQPDAGEEVKCEYCPMTFSDNNVRNEHRRAQHMDELDDRRVIKCGHCPSLFASHNAHQIHSIIVHGVLDKLYLNRLECIICGALFSHSGTFVPHLREHGAMANYACCIESCEQQFGSIELLHLHLKKHPKADEDKRKCEKCFKFYTHLAFASHQCTGNLYFCDFCGKQFSRLSAFKVHLNRHSRSKLYDCGYCARKFVDTSTRAAHQRTHTGEKPCKCTAPSCGQAFRQNVDLYRHQYKAHRIFRKKFPCTVCEQVFPENSLLRKHLACHDTQHGGTL